MGKTYKPRWGWQGRSIHETSSEARYSSEQIEDIRELHRIPKSVDLQGELEGWADAFEFNKINHEELPHPREVEAALKEIETLASALSDRLESMDPISARAFWVNEQRAHSFITTMGESPFGHSIRKGRDFETFETLEILGQEDLFESLTIIKNYANAALEDQREGRPGRPRQWALRIWVKNAQRFWIQTLDRSFTADDHDGEGITEAHAFCWDAIKVIDPTVTQPQLTNVMHWAIQKQRQENQLRKT